MVLEIICGKKTTGGMGMTIVNSDGIFEKLDKGLFKEDAGLKKNPRYCKTRETYKKEQTILRVDLDSSLMVQEKTTINCKQATN